MFECLHHHRKLTADLKAAQTRLQDLEAEAPALRAHLADLIADESATAKDIAAARAAVNKHPSTIAAAREEADILEQAVKRAHSAAVAAAGPEWAALVKEAAEGVGVPLAGVQDAAGPVCDIADQLQERWQAYRRALQMWHQTFPGRKPPPLGFPRPTIQMQNIIGSMTEAARLLRDVQRAVD
ncbi:MAG: hypothetical protein BWY09_02038 [Candidatus Hydrogenedentes bacterium ADurb.Bin179]|nr:MAG: hypothetical protein BWY09_02038 [Candidatus Hydrogenedentes bacterium ADurb.Bin179]